MDKVIPVIVVCSIGIAAAFAYIVFVIVRSVNARRGGGIKKARNEFEIDEDTLVIKLGRRHNRK